MGNKRLEWISVSSLILAISAGIVFGTISIGSQSKKADSPKNKTEQTEDKDKNTEKHKKDDLNNDSAYTDGVYEGSARGYSSDVTVKVTIKDGKIADIEVVSQDETPEYFNEAVKVLDDIIDANSTDVDSISGATISSDALKEAVQNALQKAEKKGTSKKGKSQKNKNKKKSSARSRKSRSSGSAIGHSSGPARSLASSSVNIPEGGRLKDGTYQGSASGYRGNISVSVSVRDGKIAGVDILSYNDDDAYFNSALAVINRMIGQTSANVDSVSGATYSSVGIINAVNDALNKAVEGPSQGKNNKRKANSKAANKPLAKNKKTENDKKPGSKSKDKPSTQATRPKEGKLKDGTYTGSARGFKGNIGVSVTIKDGKIASVDITTNEDDQAYFNSALGVINKMIGKQSGTVDSISGATYSSVGIMNAVNDAINKAIDNSSSKIPSLPTPAPSPSPAPSPVPTPSPLPPKEGKLKDGTYTGSARGFKGNIGVSVTIKDGKIASVDITTNEDDQAYFNSALGVINKMIGKQSGTVDSISGATYSSVGIMNAVNDAINKAIDDSSSKIPEIPKPNPSLPPLPPQPEPGPGSEEKPGEKPTPSPGSEEKPGEKPTPSPGSEEKPGKKPTPAPGSEEKPQSKEEKALEEKMRKGELAEGSFDGEGSGYNTGKGKVKTKVVIKDGKIIDIVRDEDSYPDDGDAFRTTSAKIIKFLKDPVNGKRNIAIMKMHMDMVEQIANATDPVAKARELVGDYGANYIKNNKDNPSFPLRAYASYAVKAYLSPKYKAKEMYDAVSGATLSAGGTALSVDAALAKSENDKKTNSNIDKIEIVENKDALIERNFYTHKIELLSNKADSLDLSDLQVKLIYKDKKEEIVSYKDFAKHGLEIKGEDGKVISDKMNFTDEVKNKKVLNATITHKDSKRSVDLAIKFGLYSKDYIKKMEYSLDDGKNWKEIANPALSDENKKNIADKQSIMLKKDELGKQILVKTTTVSGKTYTYKSDKDGVKFDRIRLLCTDNSYEKNNNASFAVFLVISEDKSSPSKPEHKVDPQKPETEASDGDIDLAFAPKNLNHRKIDELTIKTANGVTITSAEGLPDGLRLEGNKILGTIEIADDKFTDPYRQIDVTIHATKDGNNIKKTFKMDLYQDKDRDGVDDNEEGEEGANKFTPTTPGNKTPTIEKVRGEAEPTIDEYKALFNNIPDDGSVNVEIVRKPDMSTKGPQAMAKLKFTSTHVSGVSYKSIAVKLVDAPKGEEVEADPGDIDVNFANKLINHHKIDDVNINTGAGVKVKSIDKLPQGLSLKDGKITGSLDIPDKDFVEAYKEIEITLHGSKSAKNIKKTVKMPIYQDKDRDGVDDSDDANPNAFNPAFKGTEFKDKCIHGFIGDAEPSIDDYKKLFNNIPDDGSVTIDIIQKPNMSKKVSMAKLKFTSKYVSETSTVTVGVMLGDKLDPKVQLEKTIENLTLRSELLNGEFIGYGVGFDLSRGKLKTIVEIEHGDIKKVTFVEGKGYSGMDYMTKSSKAIPYLAGDNGKRNVAILRAHENYVNQIMAVEDMDKRKKKAEELLGKKYADSITDLRRPEMISPIVREFMAGNLGGEGKAMLDAVTGATLTSGGLGQSVDNALRMSAHDKETGNDIKEINIVEPSDVNGITGQRVLKQDRSKALDLSRLKLELVHKDGKKEVVEYKDFKAKGIEIKDRDTGKKLENNTQLTNEEMNQAIIAELTHKGSMRSTDFAIQFETYSDDYIVGMEYKFDGGNWQELVNPAKDANNVSYRQTIKINDANRGKNASFRLKTKSGKTYEYTCTSPITDYGFKYTFLKDKNVATDNPNANFALYITFEKDGASGSKPGVEKPDDESGEGSDYDIPKDAKEVEASDINANLKDHYDNYKEITPITITAGQGVTIEDVEGLPEGLDFADGSISGQLYSEDSFGDMKEYPITIYGKKDGKAIKRTLKLTVYQDKDRDGIDDNEEGEKGANRFDPTTPGNKTPTIEKVRGEAEPTLDEYKALFNNIPDDGSVKVEITQHPDMKTKNPQAIAKLKFTSTYVSGVSYKSIAVKLVEAKAKADSKVQLEKTIENLTLRSMLLDGEFIGYGVGFDLSRGKLKTIVEIEHGDIKKVTFVEGKGYSGMDYMTKSSKAIPYLAGDNGKRNVAILRAHENYVNQIMAVEDMDKRKKKAEELLGKKYADSITDLRRPEMISPIVREFMAGNLGGEGKAMLDAVTGATLTSGGLGQSVDNALRMSAHDKETGNDIKEINIVEPSDVNGITGQRVLKQDRSKALDLSRLKLELVHKDGKKEVVEYKDFKAKGIEIKDRDTGKKLENNTQLTNEEMNQAIIAELTHKGSMRSTDFAIQFETYSDDYIVGMEYKFDGGNWQELVNPAKDANNVSYRQTIKINDANRGKNASFRLKTKSGKTYEYTCTSPITDYGFKYTFLKDKNVATDNPNANFALYITFEKDGASGSKPGVEKPDDESGEGSDYDIPKDAKEVEASDINANLKDHYDNYKEITPITITAGQGVTIEDVEGLPEGLDFADGSISGQLYSEDSFASMKEYPITIYGKKAGKAIKRTLKLTVYQDKDRDGKSVYDEGDDGDCKFDPSFSTNYINKNVGEPKPSLEDYMSLVTNLPDDGSVTIEPLKEPDMTKPGTYSIRIRFNSSNVSKPSIRTINVVVS